MESQVPLDQVNWGALNWTAIAAILLFVATQVVSLVTGIVGRRRARRNLAKALLAEIKAIHRSTLASNADTFPTLMANVDMSEFIGAVTPFGNPKIYDANVGNISLFPKDMVEDIVTIYATTESVNNTMDGMKSEHFTGVTPAFKSMSKNVLTEKVVALHGKVKSIVVRLEKYTS